MDTAPYGRTAVNQSPAFPPPATASEKAVRELQTLREEVRTCTACELHRYRTNCVGGVGHANADLMLVGEGPGPDEDTAGEPFTGRSGQLLDRIIAAIGSERAQVHFGNAVQCRLDDDRHLTKKQIDACRGFLTRQIEHVDPRIIVPLGSTAWRWFSPKDKRKMADVRGNVYRWGDRILAPTYHPAFLLRSPEYKGDVWADMKRVARLLSERTPINELSLEIIETPALTVPEPESPRLF